MDDAGAGGGTRPVGGRDLDFDEPGEITPPTPTAPRLDIDISPTRLIERILDGDKAELANGWTIKRSRVANDWRLELKGDDLYGYMRELEDAGVFRERIGYDTRYFIPTGANGVQVIEAITRRRPITSVEGE